MTTAPTASAVRWTLRLALLAGLLLTLPAALAPVAAQSDQASVRVIHAVSGIGPIDVYLDGGLAVVGATFPSVTDPIDVAAGERRVTVTPSGAGTDAALVDSTIAVDAGASAEIALVGSAEAIEARSFPIDRSPIAADLARLRIINASPDAGPLTPTVAGGSELFPTVDYLLATEYADVPAGAYALDLLGAESGVAVLSLPSLELAAGDVTDLYVVGSVADETVQALLVRSPAEVAAVAGGRSAALIAGVCADPGEATADLGVVSAPGGAPLGQGGVEAVENGFATAPVAFDDLLASDHVVAVASGEEGAELFACGEIGGRLTDDGALAIALRGGDGALAGIAVLAPSVLDVDATDISIFLAPDGGAAAPAASTPTSDAG